MSLYGPKYPLVKCLLAKHLWPVFITLVLQASATGTESSSLNVIKIIRIRKKYINQFQRTFLWVHKIKRLTFRRRRPVCSFSVTELCVRRFRTGHWCRPSLNVLGLPTVVQVCLQDWAEIRSGPLASPGEGVNGDKWCTERRNTRASARHSLLSKCRTFYGSCLSVVIFTHKKIAAFPWADFHGSCQYSVPLHVEQLNRKIPKAGDKRAIWRYISIDALK